LRGAFRAAGKPFSPLEKIKRERSLRTSPFPKQHRRSYFFFLADFLAGFLADFFLAVAMENHPLFRSRSEREIVRVKINHCVRDKFFGWLRQM
jgi:hypothetical protein